MIAILRKVITLFKGVVGQIFRGLAYFTIHNDVGNQRVSDKNFKGKIFTDNQKTIISIIFADRLFAMPSRSST